jgi:serine/threonine protein kinase
MRHAPTSAPAFEPEYPRAFGSLALLKPLARSGADEVYLAWRPDASEGTCVVTLLAEEVAASPQIASRLRSEAGWLVTRVHGNLVQVYDVGQVEERLFYVSEYVEGLDLGALLDVAGTPGLPIGPAIYAALEIGEALDFIRQHEVAATGVAVSHLGLGPRSALVARDGQIKVLHRGSCLALGPEQLAGSDPAVVSLVAPELVAGGGSSSATSDVFAIGALLWHMLVGRPLAGGDLEAVTRHLESLRDGTFAAPAPSASNPAVPAAVDRLVLSALSPRPADRPGDFEALRAALVLLVKTFPDAGSEGLAELVGRSSGDELVRRSAEIAALTQEAERLARATPTGDEKPAVRRSVTLATFDHLSGRQPAADGAELALGAIIPGTRYRALSKLGSGGMGAVYAAEHVDIEKKVALKILHPDLLRNPLVLQQFRQEARAASKIGNPYICDVTDWGEVADGRVFFVMEYLDGPSLAREIKARRRLRPERALPILRQVAKALGAAHDKGIVHLDVKPDNVLLVEKDGRTDVVKVVDFGVAGLLGQSTGTAKVMGTPEYMAPERAMGKGYDHRSDIYALGCMAFEMLTGDVPFQGKTAVETLSMHVEESPDRPSEHLRDPLPAAIDEAVLLLMEKDPDRRPQSMAQVETLLCEAQVEARLRTSWDDLPLPPMATERAARIERWVARGARKNRLQLGIATGIAAVAVMTAIVLALRGNDVVPTAPVAMVAPALGSAPRVEPLGTGAPAIRPTAPAVHPIPPPPPATPAAPASPAYPAPARTAGRSERGPSRSSVAATPRAPVTSGSEAADKRPVEAPPVVKDAQAAKAAVSRGQKALEAGRVPVAAFEFKSALEADPTSPAAHAGMAEVAFENSEAREARDHARTALKLDGKNVRALVILGHALWKLENYKEARKAYERALALAPGNSEAAQGLERVKPFAP